MAHPAVESGLSEQTLVQDICTLICFFKDVGCSKKTDRAEDLHTNSAVIFTVAKMTHL